MTFLLDLIREAYFVCHPPPPSPAALGCLNSFTQFADLLMSDLKSVRFGDYSDSQSFQAGLTMLLHVA